MQRAVDQPSQPQGKSREMDSEGGLGIDGSSEGVRIEMGSDFEGVGSEQNRAYYQEQGQRHSKALQPQKNIQNTIEYSSDSHQGYQATAHCSSQKDA